MPLRRIPGAICGLALLIVGPASLTEAADPAVPAVVLSEIDASSTPTSFVLAIDTPGATEAKLVVDGHYIGKDETIPLSFEVEVAAGDHKYRVRSVIGGSEVRVDGTFVATTVPATTAPSTVSEPPVTATEVAAPLPALAPAPDTNPESDASTVTTGTLSTTTPAITSPATATATATREAPAPANVVVVDTVVAIRNALATAAPGAVILVQDGEYLFKPRLTASASGTAAAPITLRGSRNVIFRTRDSSGDYGLHITGDHWRVEGITVAHASKGIVLDGSIGSLLDGVEVFDIGAEGVHFRTCSSDGVLRNSYIHDTGRTSPQFGEGVYVGSANSNWSDFQCADPLDAQRPGDNTERVLIENNVFEDITAEGADLKEGTDSGTLRGNVFRRAGLSGRNSADSAVDAKGNGWIIEHNLVQEPNATWDEGGIAKPSEFKDAFQSHQVWSGYGTANVFRDNRVDGVIPGYGFGLYPALGNVVMCDNSSPQAALGLVGASGRASTCRA